MSKLISLQEIAKRITELLEQNGVEFTYTIDGRVLELGLVPKPDTKDEEEVVPETYWEFPFNIQNHLKIEENTDDN